MPLRVLLFVLSTAAFVAVGPGIANRDDGTKFQFGGWAAGKCITSQESPETIGALGFISGLGESVWSRVLLGQDCAVHLKQYGG